MVKRNIPTENPSGPPYRVREAAQELGVSDKTILAALKGGTLSGFRLTPDGPWLIPRARVAALKQGEPVA
jgi:excisionase family DNA binding protein